jgi:hypothetical protein
VIDTFGRVLLTPALGSMVIFLAQRRSSMTPS